MQGKVASHEVSTERRSSNFCYRAALVMTVLALLGLIDYLVGNSMGPQYVPEELYSPSLLEAEADTEVNPSHVNEVVGKWMKELTLKEKCDLLRGSVDTKGYTGFVPGVERLGIPSLRMNDGPQGFRGPRKTSTAWPCKFCSNFRFSCFTNMRLC
jgi:hypothetical protein